VAVKRRGTSNVCVHAVARDASVDCAQVVVVAVGCVHALASRSIAVVFRAIVLVVAANWCVLAASLRVAEVVGARVVVVAANR